MNLTDAESQEASFFSIARQHIVDADQSIVGYELFNRSQGVLGHTLASDISLVLNVVSQCGVHLVNSQADLFLNATHESLDGTHWDLLVPQRTIIEVPPVAGHTAERIEEARVKLQALRKRGFRLAFNHTVVAPIYKSWQDIADFVKVNVGAMAIAEKVESAAQFEVLKGIGFHFFQGYFFSRPEVFKSQSISPTLASAANLFNKLRENAELEEIELAIKRDATLGYNLLRLINSAGLGLRTKITSIQQAIMLLGTDRLQRWAALLMAAGVDGKPSLAGNMAVVRAKMMDLLAEGDFSAEEKEEAFLIGLFSLLDRMLGCPMAEALTLLKLDTAITDALLRGTGKYVDLLTMTVACEMEDAAVFAEATQRLDVSYREVNMAHMEAIIWAEAIFQE